MWQCPQCGLEVEDSLKWCWICGTSPDGTAYPDIPRAWDVNERFKAPPDLIRLIRAIKETLGKRTLPPVAGVPRRFSLGRLMLITAFFAVLFGVLSWLDAHPIVFVVVAIFVTVVGLAQAILYSGERPRKASVVAGGAVGALMSVIGFLGILVAQGGRLGIGDVIAAAFFFVLVTVLWAGVGAVLGYVAGCLIASVFLGRRCSVSETEHDRSERSDPFLPNATEPPAADDRPET